MVDTDLREDSSASCTGEQVNVSVLGPLNKAMEQLLKILF